MVILMRKVTFPFKKDTCFLNSIKFFFSFFFLLEPKTQSNTFMLNILDIHLNLALMNSHL